MMIAWHWTHLNASQREAALKDLAGCGPDGKGTPPSGPEGVVWLETPQGWRWRGGIFAYDLEQGIRIGVPAGTDDLDVERVRSLTAALAGKERPDVGPLLRTAYVVTPSALAPGPMTVVMPSGDLRAIVSPGPAPKAKPKKRRR